MIEFFERFQPTTQALLATLFTWGVTALGSSLVFFFKTINKKVFDTMLGFAAGVMIAASFWSLISPGLDLAEEMGFNPWMIAAAGFMGGGLFLFIVDKSLPHMHLGLTPKEKEGPKTSLQRSILLVLAITLHNIPEGLAVGVAFGAVAAGIESSSMAGAIALAIGIGLQNFPEGAAVSIPLRREGMSRSKAFLYGQASGIVEPIAGVLGALLVLSIRSLLPFALCFAAGAMIYVVAEELIPEAQSNNNSDYATWGVMIGFTIMMVLDVALG
ncbi:ZIP family metal transporter [Proteiniclasticum sp.]|uniref:ZIP family metal transporter n=1 Tax=Proteiniclasticum sp. TaxID=2053595 RepID=UPI0028980C17|nr:ZIP family metal transporter [Proteiniclasticum sp.]